MVADIQLFGRMNSDIAGGTCHYLPMLEWNCIDDIRMVTCHDYLYVLGGVHNKFRQLVNAVDAKAVLELIYQYDITLVSQRQHNYLRQRPKQPRRSERPFLNPNLRAYILSCFIIHLIELLLLLMEVINILLQTTKNNLRKIK